MIQFKIRFAGATPDGRIDLCRTCSHSVIIKLQNGTERRNCFRLSPESSEKWLKDAVVECNQYKYKGATSLESMKEISWVLRTDRSGGKIGFKPYRNLRGDEQFYFDDD